MSKTGRFVSIASALTLALFALSSPASAQLDKCQKSIQKEMQKLEGKLQKGLQKCADGFRKDSVKGASLVKAAAKCEGQLGKDLGLGGTTMGKAFSKLTGLTPGTCSDASLQILGHLPAGSMGEDQRAGRLQPGLSSDASVEPHPDQRFSRSGCHGLLPQVQFARGRLSPVLGPLL